MRAIKGMFSGGGMSDAAAGRLAGMLGDPTQAHLVPAILQRQGASDAEIAKLTSYIAGLGGSAAAREFVPTGGQ